MRERGHAANSVRPGDDLRCNPHRVQGLLGEAVKVGRDDDLDEARLDLLGDSLVSAARDLLPLFAVGVCRLEELLQEALPRGRRRSERFQQRGIAEFAGASDRPPAFGVGRGQGNGLVLVITGRRGHGNSSHQFLYDAPAGRHARPGREAQQQRVHAGLRLHRGREHDARRKCGVGHAAILPANQRRATKSEPLRPDVYGAAMADCIAPSDMRALTPGELSVCAGYSDRWIEPERHA